MSDQKCLGSNAYWWTRLKKPDTLQPYLRIAEGLKIPMPLVPPGDYEYDPNAKSIPRVMCHADTHHVSTYPYLKDTKYFPHTQRVEITQPHVPLFFKPWNGPWNITQARNIIAEHLARNKLSLQWYIKDCDLLEEKKRYESKSDVYSWNDWDHIDTNTNSIWTDSWWKNPNERTAWHSKTVAAMREYSATALKEQASQREQADIIARLKDVTLETPNDQINVMLNHLNRGSPRTLAALSTARYNAGAMHSETGVVNRVSNKRRTAFIDDSLLIDNNASAAYDHVKSLDSDDNRNVTHSDNEPNRHVINASGHYDECDVDDNRNVTHSDNEPNGHVINASGHYDEGDDSDDSRHFDHENRASGIYMTDHERYGRTYLAQSWTDRFEEINRENDGLE